MCYGLQFTLLSTLEVLRLKIKKLNILHKGNAPNIPRTCEKLRQLKLLKEDLDRLPEIEAKRSATLYVSSQFLQRL